MQHLLLMLLIGVALVMRCIMASQANAILAIHSTVKAVKLGLLYYIENFSYFERITTKA